MLAHSVWWLRGHPRLRHLVLQPVLSRRVPLSMALALEASRTALAWLGQPDKVRGGPWCLSKLEPEKLDELRQVADAVQDCRTLVAESAAVAKVAKGFPRQSALNRHLRSECFRCGGPLQTCSCRGYQRPDIGFAAAAKRRSGKSTASGSSKSGAKKRQNKKWLATDDKYKHHKWGIDVGASRRNDNLKYPDRWNKFL